MNRRADVRRSSAGVLGVALLLAGVLPFAIALLGNPRPAHPSLMTSPAPAPTPQAQISVAVSPSSYGLTASRSVTLTATVTNDASNQGVTWTVLGSACSGSACGTLSSITPSTAVYTAPTTAGVYSVTATSVANVTVSASATIGVTDLAGVYTYRNDLLRSGTNSKEYLLTPSNVNSTSFGKLFSCPVDGPVYTQPLWVANLAIAGGTHNVVIVGTEHDSVYAFDADAGSGTNCTLYWQASLLDVAHGAAAGATPVPAVDTGETGDLPNEIGITSTPVIDPLTNTLYVVSKTKENGSYYQRLHALKLSDGTEKASSPPVNIATSVSGTGDGSNGGVLPFIPLHENQRAGLALVNGTIYTAWASHGDNSPWHGWVIGQDAATLAVTKTFSATPNSFGGGIWMAGAAPTVDSSGNIYLITSNGKYDGKTEFGDSFVKLSTSGGLALTDWFTPFDQATLNSGNLDLGGGGAITLLDSVAGPYPHLVIGGGKEGTLYLLNRDNLGHFRSTDNNQAVQTITMGHGIYSSGLFWQNIFYISAAGTPLQAYAFNSTTGGFNTPPTSQSANAFAFPGPTPAISAAGTSNAIVWAVDSSLSGTNGAAIGPAVLYAFDANNLAVELWDSAQAASNRDQAGNAVKFVVPTVANGKVYVSTLGALTVYGLLNLPSQSNATPPTAPTNLTATPGPLQINLSWTASTDYVGVTGYKVERCQGANCTSFTEVATPTGTTYNDTGLAANTSYSYRVRATNAASLLSPYSNTASATASAPPPPAATISFVQVNAATPQSSQNSVGITYLSAQAAGDLNIVVVGWNDATSVVKSVTDTKGNIYTPIVGPTVNSAGGLSQAIYYAKNIAAAPAGGNTVTVIFNVAAAFPDIRILEYSGVDLSVPVDVTATGLGSSSISSTTGVTTANANDLLFAANIVITFTSAPGTGFTSRIITSPDGDIAEDQLVTATGIYSATASVNPAGQWIMQMVALRVAASPPQAAPTAPASLTATAAGPAQINLSWAASTEAGGTISNYLIERCQGPSCTGFVQMGTSATPSYSDTGLTGSTSYSYRVRAIDALSNLGPYSNTASATTPANSLTAPANLTAAAAGPVQINLSWGASTESGGTISQYLVERCTGVDCANIPSNFAQIGTSAGLSFNDMGRLGSTTYSYRVRAQDTLNNSSPYSNIATAATPPPTFTPPSNLTTAPSGPVQTNLSWAAGIETGGTLSQYLVERCLGAACSNFAQLGTSVTTTYSDTAGLLGSTTYSYRVRATDAANNLSAYSNTSSTTTAPPILTAPTNLAATPVGSTQINLAWTAATETGGTITQYLVESCQGSGCSNFGQIGTSTSTAFSNTGLLTGTTYSYRVRTTDAASNLGPYSNVVGATTTVVQPPIVFIQSNYAAPQSPQTSVSVNYTAAQIAGDLNVVAVGWNDATATVTGVSDTMGNQYTPALLPTVQAGTASQVIYYAKNIAAGAAGTNQVTVTFSVAAVFPDIRILEYAGIDTVNPLDVAVGAQGSSTSSSSGAVTTTNANDLIVGANLVQTLTSGVGAGFTGRMITSPDGDIVEDLVVTATGSYTATAPVNPSGQWIMQLVSFKRHP